MTPHNTEQREADTGRLVAGLDRFVTKFGLGNEMGTVIGVLQTPLAGGNESAKLTVLHFRNNIALLRVLGIEDIIPGHVAVLAFPHVLHRIGTPLFLRFMEIFRDRSACHRHELFHEILIFLFRACLVPNVILLVVEIDTAETILATDTVPRKIDVNAIIAVERVGRVITFHATHQFVAMFAQSGHQAINAVLAMGDIAAVDAVLVVIGVSHHVAILEAQSHVDVFRVFERGRVGVKTQKRRFLHKRIKLKEKGGFWIVINTVGHRIPTIAPPRLAGICLVGFFGGKHGDHILPGKTALPFIKGTLVPPRKSAYQAALRTPGRRRDLDLFVKTEILRFNDEVLLTVLALFSFLGHATSLL
jgi:hypothetical protein